MTWKDKIIVRGQISLSSIKKENVSIVDKIFRRIFGRKACAK